ncbi:helix-turn-helix domain-containing protein [Aquimarina sediminis]|uniref:helix-turn-helix domain-containing protein n=1 Tax=Aquimarina sediminis TaxID=2070536 RepID=UPI0019D4A098|nr:helix-turn-helix domain-containing protein [Aquimarina sediminis]
MNIEVICLDSEALFHLIDRVVDYLKEKENKTNGSFPWIPIKEAKKMLGVKSDTTMQKLRDEGEIRYSQPSRKIILYDLNSINAYLEKHARNTF